MTNRLLRQHWIIVFAAVCVFAGPVCVAQPSSLPHLRKQGAATQLIVDGKPFLVLGGELGNSSSSSLEYRRPVWPKLVALNAGTGLVVTFEADAPGPPLVGILSAQEGKYVEGQWRPGRWLNGDQTHQGRHLRLPPGKFDIQRVKLYRYR